MFEQGTGYRINRLDWGVRKAICTICGLCNQYPVKSRGWVSWLTSLYFVAYFPYSQCYISAVQILQHCKLFGIGALEFARSPGFLHLSIHTHLLLLGRYARSSFGSRRVNLAKDVAALMIQMQPLCMPSHVVKGFAPLLMNTMVFLTGLVVIEIFQSQGWCKDALDVTVIVWLVFNCFFFFTGRKGSERANWIKETLNCNGLCSERKPCSYYLQWEMNFSWCYSFPALFTYPWILLMILLYIMH